MGLGTQRVVAEIRARFPNEEVVRWDSDVASVAEEHATLLERFASGKVRVIVGTQMIAKGLHIPSVTLVGVILADIGLYLPDLWAGERVFQLLCQVAGRAGRGSHRGHVIIQTYSPGHYAVRAGARQDYPEFFSQEIEFRREHNNPPFSRMAHLLYQHVNEIACHGEAERVSQRLRKQAYARGLSDVDVIGPAAAQPSRLRGRYRYHLIVRAGDPAAFLRDVELPKGWSVDIDPVSVL
jgi:primosomal protein N' (replication factor Y)